MRLFRSLDPGFENPSERLLPKNRLRAYFDILRTRFGTLVLLSLLTFLFFIPYYFWRISWGAYMALPPAEELAEALMLERSFWLESFGALVEWPLLLVAALGLGGAFEIARMLSFQEGGIFLGKDFFRGLRENWKSALLAGGIWGFFSLLFRMYSRFLPLLGVPGWGTLLLLVPMGLLLLLALMLALYLLAGATLYRFRLGPTLKNNLILATVLYPKNLLALLISALFPLLLEVIPFLLVQEILLALIALYGLGHLALAYELYALSVYDRFVNRKHAPEILGEGLRKEEAEEEKPTTSN